MSTRKHYTDDPAVITLLDLIDATREIADIPNLNGPSGRHLGRVVSEALKGRTFSELTIGELVGFVRRSGEEYNAMMRRIDERLATRGEVDDGDVVAQAFEQACETVEDFR